ncbi:MAG TPA: type VI secretion protein IcmF/TssM N-terminal domain-containing protein [Myxococcota bacterium]|nr:type VI secretion protein IcmF/TssM N-terminal domain-containing protein [Myxococcota bacterium]
MKLERPQWLDAVTDLKVALPAGGAVFLVGLTAGLRLLLGGSWLVPIVVALGLALIALVTVLVVMLFRQEREQRRVRGVDDHAAAAQAAKGEAAHTAGEKLSDRFRMVMEELRSSRLGHEGVYALPWYIVIGEPGSGKSALLHESGLELPAEFARLPVPGSTRDCDFWLTNEAIVLDTAGRYARSEEAADRTEWRSLLRLVRGARPGMPVNGVVVAVPTTSLLGRSASDVEEKARQLRRTLNEITDELGVDAPVYIAVTKVDLVDGFVELSSALAPGRLVELFGWTNPERRFADAGDVALRGLDAVRSQLEAILPELLLREADPQRRRKLFVFPQELEELSRVLAIFLRRSFAPSRYEETPFLRGVYLTSARREGETLPGVSQRLGFPWARSRVDGRGPTQGIFVRTLFRDMMLEDRELALPSHRIGPSTRRALLVVGGGFLLAASLAWSIPFFGNYGAIERLTADAQSVLAGTGAAALNQLRETIWQTQQERSLLRSRLGLGGALDAALERARETYVWSFGRDYEEPTKNELLRSARRLDSGAFEALAELALDVAWLEGRGKGAAEARPDLSHFVKSEAGPADPAVFGRGYDAWLAWAPEEHVTRRLQQEREVFDQAAATLLDLDRLEQWNASSGEGHGPVRYSEVGLPASEADASVPGTYTHQSWDGFVKGLIAAVERAGGASPATLDAFKRSYVARFDGNWRRYLMGTPLPAASDAGVRNSPYLRLVDQIDSQTKADLPRTGPEPSWMGSLHSARTEEAKDAKDAAAWPRYLQALDAVVQDVETAQAQPEAALDLAQRVARREQTSFRAALDLIHEMVPPGSDPQAAERIRQILAMPVLNGFSAVLDSAGTEIDRRWSERIGERFSGELTEAQLKSLYAPRDGELARFQSELLDPFYADGRAKPILEDRALTLGEGFRGWLHSAGALRDAMFGGGGALRIAVRLEGVPSQVHGGNGVLVSRRDLRLTCAEGVDTFTYREGTGSHTFQWSPECQEVSLRVWVHEGEGERELQPRKEARGPLAFPSLLREAKELEPGHLQWSLSYPQDGLEVLAGYLLRSGDAVLAIAHTEPPSSTRN